MSELSATVLNKKTGFVITESAAIILAREVESLESQLAAAIGRAEKAELERDEATEHLLEYYCTAFRGESLQTIVEAITIDWKIRGNKLETAGAERDSALRHAERAEKVVEAARAWSRQGSRSKWSTPESNALWDAIAAFDSDAGEGSGGQGASNPVEVGAPKPASLTPSLRREIAEWLAGVAARATGTCPRGIAFLTLHALAAELRKAKADG
jgi:hypothetical protein